ncbi:MAG: DNA-binding response regulator [Proteobacteria bacterium]|nr:DNA-binding response regulator [Pseudomonadota bacterium]
MTIVAILATVVIGSGIDLFMDLSHGATTEHIAKEALVVLVSAAAIAWLLYSVRQQTLELEALRQEHLQPVKGRQPASDYVLSARQQLGEVVAKQFGDWDLTASEKEVGWLLIKGLSLKEIAAVRNTLEKTVRQQASAIYKKAGISGRHAFSAWFIEEML